MLRPEFLARIRSFEEGPRPRKNFPNAYQVTSAAIEEVKAHYGKDAVAPLLTDSGYPKGKKASKQLASMYFEIIDGYFANKFPKNWAKAPVTVKEAILDAAYNAGPAAVSRVSGIQQGLKDADWVQALKGTLHVVNTHGEISKGLLKRRMSFYNSGVDEIARMTEQRQAKLLPPGSKANPTQISDMVIRRPLRVTDATYDQKSQHLVYTNEYQQPVERVAQ